MFYGLACGLVFGRRLLTLGSLLADDFGLRQVDGKLSSTPTLTFPEQQASEVAQIPIPGGQKLLQE